MVFTYPLLFLSFYVSVAQATVYDVSFDIDPLSIISNDIVDFTLSNTKFNQMNASEGDVLKWDQSVPSWVIASDDGASSPNGTITQIDLSTGLIGNGTNFTTTGTVALDVGTGANQILQYDASADLTLTNRINIAQTGKLIFNNTSVPQSFSFINDGIFKIFNDNNAQTILSINSSGSFSVAGKGVCLQNGTNCPSGNTGDITQVTAGTGLTGTTTSGAATLNVDVGTAANKIVQLDSSARLPAVSGALLTNLPFMGDITGVIAGTSLSGGGVTGDVTISVDVGTTALKVVQLDAAAKLPALDGSQLLNLPPQGDITSITAGTSLTGGGVSGDITLSVDVGTSANQILRLDSNGKLPAVDGSLITNIVVPTPNVTGVTGGAAPHPAAGAGCPSGYIKVPGDSVYDTSSFCIMKYEAKFNGQGAVSIPAGIPARTTVYPTSALGFCRALGPGYVLPNNNEWMTVASNIAQQGNNWSSGTLGSGCLYGGHMDNNPSAPLDATADDTQGWYGTGDSSTDTFECPFNTTVGASDGKEQRRTFTLSNGEVMWDFSGNLAEYINLFVIESKVGAGAGVGEISNYTTSDNTTHMTTSQIRPLNAVQSWWTDTWNSNQGTGRYSPGSNGSGGTPIRGGQYNNGAITGIFHMDLTTSPASANAAFGFRCVFRPAAGGP